jgi:hypothetical protein
MRASLNKKYASVVQVTVFVLCISSVCVAGVVEFTDQDTFTKACSREYFIDFESYGDGTPVPPGDVPIDGDEWLNLGIQFAGMEAGDSLILSEKAGMAVSPTHALATRNPSNRCSSLITFLTPVDCFGLYIVDNETGGPNSSTERITLKDENGNVIRDFPMPGGRGPAPPLPFAHDFRGYLSTIPIAQVEIIEDSDGEGTFLEDVMYCPVPEPATLLLLGLAGLTLLGKRKAV